MDCDRDWAHLPAVAVQAIGAHCCPASMAKLRLICSAWNQSLAAQFSTLHVGPGALTWADASTTSALQQHALPVHESAAMLGVCLQRAFPAVSKLDLTVSSSREYPHAFVHDMTQLLARQPRMRCLVLREVHELDELDTLDPSSLWDVLVAALRLLSAQLQVLHVLGCFWNQPELFGSLRQLTAVTELRLSNTPLETAYELRVVASMTQLVTLEVGIIYDGSSSHHDVPRAVELLGDLQQLQALSIPMWRRSLGGRAHPLATALSAALLRLTGLTNLAVDGKFSQLAVVSSLTNLQQLASAAPLSKEGWQAICHLPHLTLLTSLTPPLEVLQLNPQRPHMGCDLARLVPKAGLAGIDVAVLSPDHLAPVAQFTSLQRLNLRCASTFHAQQQQSQILAVMASLPPTLTSLSIGPMIPLCPELFSSIASSCSSLRELHASFTHQATAASHSGLSDTSTATFASATPGFRTEQQQQHWQQHPDSTMPWSNAQQQQQLTVGEALSQLQQLWDLELVLLSEAERCESPMAVATAGRRSTSNGGPLGSPLPTWAHPGAGGAGGTTSLASDSQAAHLATWSAAPPPLASPAVSSWGTYEENSSSSCKRGDLHTGVAQVQLELLPRSLKCLKLEGNWLLTCSSPLQAVISTAPISDQQQQQWQKQQVVAALQQQGRVCSVCKGTGRPGRSQVPTAEADSSSAAAYSLCDCLQSLNLAGLQAGQQAAADVMQPGHPQPPPTWPTAAAAAVASPSCRPGRASSSSSSGPGSPARGLLSGLKRPASPASDQPQAASAAVDVVMAGGGTSAALEHNTMLVSSDVKVSAVTGDQLEDLQQSLQKRTKSQTRSETATLPSLPSRLGNSLQPQLAQQQQQQLVVQQAKADDADALPQLPQLVQLCLFRVQTSIPALAALVKASGVLLRKLELLQLSVLDVDGADANMSHPESVQQQQRQQVLQGNQGMVNKTRGAGLLSGSMRSSFLTTEQLLHLPVAWSCLEELHIHPYHLWGMLASGSMRMDGSQHMATVEPAGGVVPTAAQSLQHVTQLVNLRHMYIVNVPVTFEAATPAHAMIPPACAARVPSVSLPLHDMVAVKALLAGLLAGLQQLPALRQLLLYLGPVVGQASACHSIDEWCEAGEELLQALPHVRVRGFLVPQATTGWPTDALVINLGQVLQGYPGTPST